MPTIVGTSGPDTINFTSTSGGETIDLLEGNDTLNLGWLGYSPIEVTTGAGIDTIRFTRGYDSPTTTARITDFQTGAGGDVIDIMPFLDWFLQRAFIGVGWISGNNPFMTGHLELRQVGTMVELWVHPIGAAGANSSPVAQFQN